MPSDNAPIVPRGALRTTRAFRRLTSVGLLLGGTAALVACSVNDGRVKTEPWQAHEEASSLGAQSQAITITGNLFFDDFADFSATTNSPVGSGKKWYIQQNFKPNGEIELYGSKVCPDSYAPPMGANLGTADNAVGSTPDANNFAFCMVNDSGKGASNALWLRAHNDGAGNIHSGRINSKRLMEFAPTSTYGIKTTVRLRNFANSWDANPTHGHGWWPAVWFLQRNIAESPIINDTDNVSWPCEGAHEIDLFEHGSLTGAFGQAWGPNYNKSSMHYRNDFCIPQSVQNTLGAEVYNDTIADNNYHTYSMELETTAARFYYDGVQYGQQNVQGLKFDVPLFWIINAAVGGNLGGGVDWSRFTGDYKSMLVDYVTVDKFDYNLPAPRINIADTTDPNAATKLEAEPYTEATNGSSANSGMQSEVCSEGGRDMGWIDALPDGTGDWAQWDINVPSAGDWKLEQRNAVNNGGSTAGFRIRVDGTQVASGNLPSTGGWQTWQTNGTNSFTLTAGNHTIQWQATTSGQNLNWVRLVKAVAATCSDFVKNQGETNIDCGGPCGACPTCSNGVKDSFSQLNWFETGVDCGGPCAACSGNGNGAGVGSKLEAENAAATSGIQIETTPGNGTTTNSVGYFDAGDWIKFTGVNMTTLTGVRIRAAGANSGGVIEVRSASTTGLVLGTYTMATTGGWTTWADRDVVFSATDTWTAGDLYIIGKTGSGIMNIDNVTLLTKDNSGGQGTAFPIAIPNPGFAGGTISGWSTFFNNGGSAAAVAGGSDYWGRITVPAITSPAVRWHQQMYQDRVSDGGTYTLSVWMHGVSSAKTIDCFLEKNGGDYASYNFASVTSTGSTDWKQCTVTSTAIPAGQSFKFGVRGGDSTATYDVDDFQLIDNP